METNTQYYSDLAIPPGEYLLEATTEMPASSNTVEVTREVQKIMFPLIPLEKATDDWFAATQCF